MDGWIRILIGDSWVAWCLTLVGAGVQHKHQVIIGGSGQLDRSLIGAPWIANGATISQRVRPCKLVPMFGARTCHLVLYGE